VYHAVIRKLQIGPKLLVETVERRN
jgi:hypothetical protein